MAICLATWNPSGVTMDMGQAKKNSSRPGYIVRDRGVTFLCCLWLKCHLVLTPCLKFQVISASAQVCSFQYIKFYSSVRKVLAERSPSLTYIVSGPECTYIREFKKKSEHKFCKTIHLLKLCGQKKGENVVLRTILIWYYFSAVNSFLELCSANLHLPFS
jgi:hypothetical protein